MSEPTQSTKFGEEPESPQRRKVLGWLVGVINLLVVGAVIGPVLGFMGGPLARRRESPHWIPVMDESDLPDGSVREVKYAVRVQDGYRIANHEYVVYLKRNGSEVIALDPTCTHLGCRVKYQEEKSRFFCPCHGGVFDAEGKVVSGPPPRALDRHSAKFEGGKVWVKREA